MVIAGIVACLIAPVVVYLQFQIQDTDSTLHHVHCVSSLSLPVDMVHVDIH